MLINKDKIRWYGPAVVGLILLLLGFGFCGCSPMTQVVPDPNPLYLETSVECDKLADMLADEGKTRCEHLLRGNPAVISCETTILDYECPKRGTIDADIEFALAADLEGTKHCATGVLEGTFTLRNDFLHVNPATRVFNMTQLPKPCK